MNKKISGLIIFLSVLLLDLLLVFPVDFNAVDFPVWRHDVESLLCQLISNDKNCQSLTKFPIAYLINAIIVFLLSDFFLDPEYVLTILNIFFLLLGLVFIRVSTKIERSYEAPLFYLASLIFSSIPAFYIHSGALEVQSGMLLGIYSICIYLCIIREIRNKFLFFALFVSALLTPLYKDTNIIFMVLIYFFTLFFSLKSKPISYFYRNFEAYKSSLYILLVSGFLSVSILMGFNYYKYRSIFPLEYFEEARLASPPIGIKARYFLWTFFSLNGGILISWCAPFAVLFLGLKIEKRSFSKFGILLSTILVTFSALLMSNWWTPFGWDGWGNRLFIPQAITCLMILSCTSITITRKKSNIKLYVVFIPLLVLSLFYVGVSYSPQRNLILGYSLWGSDSCKAVAELRRFPEFNSWEFKKTETHLRCHFDRFKYIPYQKMDMSPLSRIEKNKEYILGNGNGRGVVGRGWSHIESWGVWSDSDEVIIRFVPKSRVQKIRLKLRPFVNPNGPNKQRFVIKNKKGDIIYKGSIKKDSIIELDIQKDNSVFIPTDIFKITIHLYDAVSPAVLGLSNDNRELGLALMSLTYQ